jgi:signal peptidase I
MPEPDVKPNAEPDTEPKAERDAEPKAERDAERDAEPKAERDAASQAEAPAEGRTEERRPASMTFGRHAWAFTKELVAVVIGAILVSSLLRAFVGQMFLIPSVSMENTLKVDDRVVVEKLTSTGRGQIVVFTDPGGWLGVPTSQERGPIGQALEFIGVLPDTATGHLIKRVIGMPGDRVVCCDRQGRISVNGQPINESSYLYRAPGGQQVKPSEIRFDVTVPADRIFVLGDNRSASRDSRCHLNDVQPGEVKGENAFVPLDLVVGRAIFVAWPLADVSQLPTPAVLTDVPSGVSPPVTPLIKAGPEASC